MASVASEADRSLAKVFIAVLAGCLLPGGGTFWLKDIEGKKSPNTATEILESALIEKPAIREGYVIV